MEDMPGVTGALISVTISQTLYEISEAVHDDVGNALYKKYNCYFHDCLNHPEYLVDVIQQIFGDGYISIIHSINKKLEEFSYQKPINEFLLGLYK
ncbi:MAG: hypothetical protein KGZ34_07885 [Nitrosarchaeum sp.]|nr:hypothetical protein [Nitrosarchaeum sp.]